MINDVAAKKPTGSYQFEWLEGKSVEASFLKERSRMRLEGFPSLLDRHLRTTPGRFLEVGCGQGVRTAIIAEKYPTTDVVGIDRSIELLESAKSEQSRPNLQFEYADLYQLPYAENCFDAVYARLVFMHLTDPFKALQELQRVLKPGGKLLIEDADRDCMFFEPEPPTFRSFWSMVQAGQRRLGGNPNIGRKLAPMMKDCGFQDVAIECQPIVGAKDEIQFLTRTLMPSLNIYLLPQDRDFGEKAISDLEAMATQANATFYHFWFVVSATKN